MFSPMGKKKILLQHKFGQAPSQPASPDGSIKESPPGSPKSLGSLLFKSSASLGSSTDGGRPKTSNRAATANLSRLEKLLSDSGAIGQAMRKLMEATAHYRPERDSIRLKAFQFADLQYDLFRSNIQSVFWVSFTDEEFNALANFYDSQGTGIIDGYVFLKSFTRLSAIRKERETVELKEKQDAYEARRKEEEELKELAKERKNELRVIWDVPAEIKDIALKKLEAAAKAFDPGHPAAPSTAGFNVNAVKPSVFREMLKLTLNLKVNAAELGAILKEFRPDITDGPIPASDFLKFFYRLGFEARDHDRQLQRKRQEELDKKAEEERQRKIAEANKKLKTFVDYNFSEGDESSAMDKLRTASEKYDKTAPGAVALDGFECEELSPLDFRELLKRVFNISFSPTELGFVIQKYDFKHTGNVHCKSFITEFLRMGNEERHKHHIEQLDKQRKLIEDAEKEHIEKMKAVQKSERVPISQTFTATDLQTAMQKLTVVAAFFDKSRGAGFQSFEPQSLNLVQFKRALKRTFDITFTAPEMGAMVNHLQKNEQGEILCHPFLTMFIQLGTAERDRLRSEQMNRQRELDEKAAKEEKQRQLEKESKVLYEVDYTYEEEHLTAAVEKMTESARKYDAAHPAAVGLNSFEQKSMTGAEFKEVVRRTFHLVLSPKETGALLGFFHRRLAAATGKKMPHDQIDCGEFLKYFLQLGVAERGRLHSEQLERQRREDQERQEEHERKVKETATRGTYEPDMNFTEEDKTSIHEKLLIAAEKFDKNHPAAPSLEAFTASHMTPGVFRENIKSCFGVKATRKEIGYLLSVYDKDNIGQITTKDFLIKFFAVGKKARDEKRAKTLEEQREALKQMQRDEELRLQQLVEKSDFELDRDYTSEDYHNAVKRMTVASEKYDKMHPSAPNLDGFTGGPLAPGAFRELMKRAFSIYLSPREVTAILDRFHVDGNRETLDGKKFLIFFMRLGFEARAKRKTANLQMIRKHSEQRKHEEERRLRMALQRVEFELPKTFTDTDRDAALLKLTQAAMGYDKNAPGAASLDGFNELYMIPAIFREVLKRTFNVALTPAEVAALTKEFQYQTTENVDTQKFLVFFIKTGFEERDKFKAMELEKQRRAEYVRQKEEEKKKKDADAKMALAINYTYTREQRESAFAKLAHAAKKYDKAHPAAMSLDGFEQKTMAPTVFREMIKRTFGLQLEAEELGALIHFFDQENKGSIHSHNFLTYFLKLGITERERDHRQSMQKLREDAAFREKFHQEKMAAQWAKAELSVTSEFTSQEAERAWEMLTVAASKFDVNSSAGTMGLTAFQTSTMSPAVFREMLKRCFDLRLTNGELASLIHRFAKKDAADDRAKTSPGDARASTAGGAGAGAGGGGSGGLPLEIDCNLFMVIFTQIGAERRYQIRTAQIEKQRSMSKRAEQEAQAMKDAMDKAADLALLNKASASFSDDDFRNALEKVRDLAAHFDRSHPSAPSLKGFQGADMTPSEFQNMLSRTFHTFFSPAEIAALLATFPAQYEKDKKDKAKRNKTADDSRPATAATVQSLAQGQQIIRISNAAFMAYFHRINRQEQAKRDQQRIEKERLVAAKAKKEHQDAMKAVVHERMARLNYRQPEDEQSCVDKIKAMAQEFCIDSAPYIEGLRSLKGPAWPADKLRSLLDHIFHIKLTLPEMGVLRDTLAGEIAGVDPTSGEAVFDGPRFLKWFYALSRLEEQAMLSTLDKGHRATRTSMGGRSTSGSVSPSFSLDGDTAAMAVGVTLETMRELGRPPPATMGATGGGGGGINTRASTASVSSNGSVTRQRQRTQQRSRQSATKAALVLVGPGASSPPPPMAPPITTTNPFSPPSSPPRTANGARDAVDSMANFTKSTVKDQNWFLALPSAADAQDATPSRSANVSRGRASDKATDVGVGPDTASMQAHLASLFNNERTVADYDPSFAGKGGSGGAAPSSASSVSSLGSGAGPLHASVDLGVLLRRNNNGTAAQKKRAAASRHPKANGASDSQANANGATGNASQLAKTQPVGNGRGRLTSQSTAALVVPASLSSLSYTEEVSAPGQSRHREFLDRVFGDKGNVGRVDDGNAPAYGSAANRLNPIAELMRFKKQMKKQQQDLARPGTTQQAAKKTSHGSRSKAAAAASATAANSSGDSVHSQSVAGSHASQPSQSHKVSSMPPRTPTKLEPLSLTTALALGGTQNTQVASSKGHKGATKTTASTEMAAAAVPSPSPSGSFFYFPGAFHAPGGSDAVDDAAGQSASEERKVSTAVPADAPIEATDEKAFLQGILAPSI